MVKEISPFEELKKEKQISRSVFFI